MNALGERESAAESDFVRASQMRRRYWRKTQRMTGLLLMIWFGVTFCVSYFARELNFEFFGWPFSFWVASQGALFVYGLIIAFYAWYMGRLDALHGFEESQEE